MNITLYHDKYLSVEDMLIRAYQYKYIDNDRRYKLEVELKELYKNMIYHHNHELSTSISISDYNTIRYTVSYIIYKGLLSYHDFKDYSLSDIYNRGKRLSSLDISRAFRMYKKMVMEPLRFDNDAYKHVLNVELKRYFKNIRSYDYIYYYADVREDLDYPLVDGLALYHDMYDKRGSELLLYYGKRLYTEYLICHRYNNEINILIKDYEYHTGISIKDTSINLLEIIYPNIIASIIHKRDTLIIYDERLRNISISQYDVDEYFKHNYSKNEYTYLMEYQDILSKNELLIHHEEYEEYILSNNECDEDMFKRHVDNLMKLDGDDKIRYLHESNLCIYDIADILAHHILNDNEILDYFKSLDEISLKVFIKTLYKNGVIDGLYDFDEILNKYVYDKFEETSI